MKIIKRDNFNEFVFLNKYILNCPTLEGQKYYSKFLNKYNYIKKKKISILFKKRSWFSTLEFFNSDDFKNMIIKAQNKEEKIILKSKDLALDSIVFFDLLPKEYINVFLFKIEKLKDVFRKKDNKQKDYFDREDYLSNFKEKDVVNSWMIIDDFEIEDTNELKKYFSNIKIELIGLSESFLIIKYTVQVTKEVNETLEKIISSYIFESPEIYKTKKRNKIRFGIRIYGDLHENAKRKAITNYIIHLKSIFFEKTNQIMKSIFFDWKVIIPSVQIYKIDSDKIKYILKVYSSSDKGVDFDMSKESCFLFEDNLNEKYASNSFSLFINKNQKNKIDFMFRDVCDLITNKFADYFLLNGLSRKINSLIYSSQLKINKNINIQSKFGSVLSLKLDIDKKLNFYRRLYNELSRFYKLDKTNTKMESYMKYFDITYDEKIHSYCFLTMYTKMEKDIIDKCEFMGNIFNYFNENSKLIETRYNYGTIIITIIISLLTLICTVLFGIFSLLS